MNENKFDKFYSKKTIPELIEKILRYKITGTSMDKEWFDALILHFPKRDMTTEQKDLIEHILITDSKTLNSESLSEQINQSNNNPSITTVDIEKYPALRTLSIVYKISAWIIGICCFLAAIIFLFQKELLSCLECLLVGLLSTITIIAISELLILFIDLEYNTRQKLQ